MDMAMNVAVTVIVPVFQAEMFIERCCRSLFGQTMDNMEFIFVNDGSKDNSIDIIKEVLKDFPDRSQQVKILDRRENRGVAYSRQEGLDNASGEFIIFCDSDDWIDPYMYKSMYDTAVEKNADVVCCGYEMVGESGTLFREVFDRENFFDDIKFNISPLTGSLWSKLIKSDLIRSYDIKVPENIGWGEDFSTAVSCLLVASKIVCMDSCPYHYWLNENSITHTLTERKIAELMKVGTHMEGVLKRLGKLEQYSLPLNYLKFQIKLPLLTQRDFRNIRLWKESYPECHKDIWKYDSPFSLKLAAWLIANGMTPLAKAEFAVRDLAKAAMLRLR